MINFSKPTLGDEEIEAVTKVLRSGWLAAGKETEAFEQEFAEYIGVKYAVFTNSCTSALKVAYKWAQENTLAAGAMPLELSVPRNTFCATYSAIKETPRATFYWHDTIPKNDTWSHVQRVNVHYGGVKDETPCLIEDSAHRIEKNDSLVGRIRCYSFYATKNMTTGSGGMLVTNDKEIYDYARLCWKDGLSTSTNDRLNGQVGYEVKIMAGGYDGNDIAAAIGRVQLKRLPEFTRRRNDIVRQYNEAFGQNWSGNHLYPYFTKDTESVYGLINHLKEYHIQASYHYPNTGWLGVSLPLYPSLTQGEIGKIITVVKDYNN